MSPLKMLEGGTETKKIALTQGEHALSVTLDTPLLLLQTSCLFPLLSLSSVIVVCVSHSAKGIFSSERLVHLQRLKDTTG